MLLCLDRRLLHLMLHAIVMEGGQINQSHPWAFTPPSPPHRPTPDNRDPIEAVHAAVKGEGKAAVTDQAPRLAGLAAMAIHHLQSVRVCVRVHTTACPTPLCPSGCMTDCLTQSISTHSHCRQADFKGHPIAIEVMTASNNQPLLLLDVLLPGHFGLPVTAADRAHMQQASPKASSNQQQEQQVARVHRTFEIVPLNPLSID
jgi:hypothetical protein